MPPDLGITAAQRDATLSLARMLLAEQSLDRELRRRLTWVVWRLEDPRPINENTLSELAMMRRA